MSEQKATPRLTDCTYVELNLGDKVTLCSECRGVYDDRGEGGYVECVAVCSRHVRSELVDELVAALKFYADPRKYQGANHAADPDEEMVAGYYRLDVSRDGGEKARAVLAKVEKDAKQDLGTEAKG